MHLNACFARLQAVGKVVKFTDKIEDFESKPVWLQCQARSCCTNMRECYCSCRQGPVVIGVSQFDCAPRRCCLSISSDTSASAGRWQQAVLRQAVHLHRSHTKGEPQFMSTDYVPYHYMSAEQCAASRNTTQPAVHADNFISSSMSSALPFITQTAEDATVLIPVSADIPCAASCHPSTGIHLP